MCAQEDTPGGLLHGEVVGLILGLVPCDGVLRSHALVDCGGDEFGGVLDLLWFFGWHGEAGVTLFSGDGGGVFRGDRSEADEEFDSFGDGDIQIGEFVFGDEHEESGGGVGGCGEEDTEDFRAGIGLLGGVTFSGDEAD